ncbi:MAG: signal peptidase I [Blautia marasmi]
MSQRKECGIKKWQSVSAAGGAGVVGLVVLLCVLIFIITTRLFQPAIVSGDCMAPTVRDGEYYIINKWAYKTDVPSRRDILVYEKDGIYHITRVIGLPGECVEMRQGDVYIDGRRYGVQGLSKGLQSGADRTWQ